MSKRIIIWKDKYGSHYYAADTMPEKAYAYHHIFNTMLKAGYYRDMDSAEEDIKIWEKQLSELESLQSDLENNKIPPLLVEKSKHKVTQIMNLKRQILYKDHAIRIFRSAKKGNVKSVQQFIRDRNNFEYEHVRTDTLIYPEEE